MGVLRMGVVIAVFVLSLGLFLPKVPLLELVVGHFGKPYNVVFVYLPESGESQIVMNGSPVATIELLSLTSLLFYHSISAETITLQGLGASFLPPKVNEAEASWSLLSPMTLYLASQGEFGTMSGVVDFSAGQLLLEIRPSETMLQKFGFALQQAKKVKDYYQVSMPL